MPERVKVRSSTIRESLEVRLHVHSGRSTLSARAIHRPPSEGNTPAHTTNTTALEFERNLAPGRARAILQQTPSASVVFVSKVKQAESTVDQLGDSPLEGIPAHRDLTIIVHVFTWNTHAQIEMGLPPVAPVQNPLIIEQSRKTGAFGQVSVTRRQVESIINTRTSVMTLNIGTTPNSQPDVMIKPAEAT